MPCSGGGEEGSSLFIVDTGDAQTSTVAMSVLDAADRVRRVVGVQVVYCGAKRRSGAFRRRAATPASTERRCVPGGRPHARLTVAAMSEPIQFSLDPRCPWCWQTSKWVRQLEAAGTVEVRWGTFSLELQNFDKPLDEFDGARSVSGPALRTFFALREHEGDGAAGAFRRRRSGGLRRGPLLIGLGMAFLYPGAGWPRPPTPSPRNAARQRDRRFAFIAICSFFEVGLRWSGGGIASGGRSLPRHSARPWRFLAAGAAATLSLACVCTPDLAGPAARDAIHRSGTSTPVR